MIREHGFAVASMGPQILRTDVASIASVGIVMQNLRELMASGHHQPEDSCSLLLEAPRVQLPTEEDLRFISFYKESWKPKQKAERRRRGEAAGVEAGTAKEKLKLELELELELEADDGGGDAAAAAAAAASAAEMVVAEEVVAEEEEDEDEDEEGEGKENKVDKATAEDVPR
eukprot:scaffold574_cov246-Pinguiococcus_pyrenoidosus.AAC.25